ncbi:hypothetical protein GCM10008933_08500 [Paenibacillus motobuensis]|uniref:Uncharacterized protein n=1 Tax=Paenibacillus motobuensis TaxID=295324 RepID=A0ABN0Y1S3_9BACL
MGLIRRFLLFLDFLDLMMTGSSVFLDLDIHITAVPILIYIYINRIIYLDYAVLTEWLQSITAK